MIISIAGGSGSGKSYMAYLIKERLKNEYKKDACIISLDNYYKNILKEKFENYDHPDAFHIETLMKDLDEFFLCNSINIRKYDFQTKESIVVDKVENIHILIIEGLYSFYYENLKNKSNLKIFLDTDIDLAIKRRIERDKRERNISEEENKKMIKEFVIEMYHKYVVKQRQYADLVVKENDFKLIMDNMYENIF